MGAVVLIPVAITIHYVNEYVDRQTDALTERFAWHVLGHGAWWPWGSGLGSHAHTLRTVLLSEDHLRADPIALISKFAELALLVVLATLYRRN